MIAPDQHQPARPNEWWTDPAFERYLKNLIVTVVADSVATAVIAVMSGQLLEDVQQKLLTDLPPST